MNLISFLFTLEMYCSLNNAHKLQQRQWTDGATSQEIFTFNQTLDLSVNQNSINTFREESVLEML